MSEFDLATRTMARISYWLGGSEEVKSLMQIMTPKDLEEEELEELTREVLRDIGEQ